MTRVLIVEDERIVAEDIKNSLESLGYTVCAVASTGMEALKKVGEAHPDAVLMDIILRGKMDGIEAASRIRFQYDIPVIYLTAYDDQRMVGRAKETEPYGYVVKPFKEGELHAAIETAIYKHRTERKSRETLEWLTTTLTSMGHGVISADAGGLITYMNPVAEELTGWIREDAVGHSLKDVFHILTEKDEESGTNEVPQGTISRKTYLLRGRESIPIEGTVTPLKDDSGTTHGLVVVFSDITEYKRIEEEKDRILRGLDQKVRELTCLYNLDLTLKRNASVAEILEETARIFPSSWQYEGAGCRIVYDRKYETGNFRETEWMQSADIVVQGERAGTIEVSYKNPVHEQFLEEEEKLLNTVAGRLGEFLERKKAEESLSESEARYRALFDQTVYCVFVHDFEGNSLDANEAALSLLGYRREDIPSLGFSSLIEEAQMPQALKITEEIRRTGHQVTPITYVLKRKDGTRIFVEVEGSLIFKHGKPYAIQEIARDITASREAEMILKESESRYHSLFDDSPLSLWVEDWSQIKAYIDTLRNSTTDLRTYFREHPEAVVNCARLVRILDVNKAALVLHEAEDKAELLTSLEPIFTDETFEVFAEEVIALTGGNPHFESEIVHRTLRGRLKHVVLFLNVPPSYEDTLSKVLVSVYDITERKQTEMQLKNLFEVSKLINSTMDTQRIFRVVSDSIRELVGFDYFVIFLVSKDREHIYAAYTSERMNLSQNLKRGEWVVGQCIEGKKTILTENFREKTGIPGIPDSASKVVIPLVVEDECVGALYISKVMPYGYDSKDVDILKPLSEIVSSAVRNSRLYDEIHEFSRELEKKIEERSRRTEVILNAKQSLETATSWEKGLAIIVESICKLGFDRCGVFLVNAMRRSLEFHYGVGVELPALNTWVPLNDEEYFGVKCVLEKRTIFVEDSTKVKGKQITSNASSFVWIPIVVRNEAFAALGADNIKTKKGFTVEEVKNLEILAGMCAAFIDRTRLLLEPVAENSLRTELKYRLESSEGYIIGEKRPEKSFQIFVDLVTHGIPGFVVSRTYPEKLRRKYRLEKTPLVWLSKSHVEGTVDPNDLAKLIYMIQGFTKKSPESVVLLDGLEYLIIQTGFEAVLKFVHQLKDIIVLNNSRLIVSLRKETLSAKEYNYLARDLTLIESE